MCFLPRIPQAVGEWAQLKLYVESLDEDKFSKITMAVGITETKALGATEVTSMADSIQPLWVCILPQHMQLTTHTSAISLKKQSVLLNLAPRHPCHQIHIIPLLFSVADVVLVLDVV